jgi:hypothetical protein
MVSLGYIRITSKRSKGTRHALGSILCVYTRTIVGQVRHNSRFHLTGTYDRLLRPPRTLQHYLYPKRQPFALFIYQLTECDNQNHILKLHQLLTLTPTCLTPILTIANHWPPPSDHALIHGITGQWSQVALLS